MLDDMRIPPLSRTTLNRERALTLGVFALGVIMLMMPAFLAGRPAVFYDTVDYYLQGAKYSAALDLPVPPLAYDPEMGARVVRGVLTPDTRFGDTFMAGRSPVYGLLLYWFDRAQSLWALIAAQALIVAGVLMLVARVFVPNAPRVAFAVLAAGLSLGSTLAFFTSFAMPDVLAGVAIAAAGVLLFHWQRVSVAARVFLGAVIGLAAATHNATMGIVLVSAVIGAALLIRARLDWRSIAMRGGAIVCAALVAMGVLAALGAVHHAAYGTSQQRPVYLAARVLADGPGRRVLEERCPTPDLAAWCGYRHLPLDNADDILVSDDPARGVLRIAPYETVLKLSKEEPRLVWLSFVHDPLALIGSALANGARQLGLVTVYEPLIHPSDYVRHWYWRQTHLPELMMRASDTPPGARFVPREALGVFHILMLAVSLAAIIFMSRRLGADEQAHALRRFALFGILAVVANAFLCGALSGAYPRYEARVIWLVPMIALLMALDFKLRARIKSAS